MGFSYQSVGVVRTGADRATLVRRTYALVFASVCVTVLGTWFGLGQPQMMAAVIQHPWITMLCTFAPLFLAMRARTAFPQNVVLVGLFAFVMGLTMAPVIYMMERTNPGVTGNAAILTLSTFGVLTGYAFVSRRDFSAWGSFFTIGLWVLIATSLLNFFFQSQAAGLWISAGTVLVFSGLLIFDTWRLRNVYGPDDHVMAAVQIYLDLLNMFMAILNLLGGGRRN